MAENKKGVILYSDLIYTFEELTDDEAGKLIKHLFRYVNDQNPEAPDKLTKLLFQPIKLQLKRDLEKWESIREKRSEAGKQSAKKREQIIQNSASVESVKKTSTNPTVNVSVNVNDTVNVIHLDEEEEEPDSEFEMFVQTAKVKSLVKFVKQTFPKLEETLKMKIGEKNYLERQEAFILRNNEGSYTTNNDFRMHYTNFILKTPPKEEKEKYFGQKEKINKVEQFQNTHNAVINDILATATIHN